MKALVWEDGMGESYETVDIPAELAGRRRARGATSSSTSSSQYDENVLEKYVGEEEITADDLRTRAARRHRRRRVVPVLCGTAFKNKGVQPLLDAVVDYLPSPLDVAADRRAPTVKDEDEAVERKADDDEPFAALAFKIMSDPYVGKLTYFRVYSGKLAAGQRGAQRDQGPARSASGASSRCTPTTARTRTRVFAGDIVAAVGLKNTTTGDTLCDPAHPIVLERMEFPEPVISVAIEPKTKVDQDKLGKALGALSEEDPTFQVRTDDETGQTIIARHGRAAPRRARRPHGARVLAWPPTSASRRSPTARRSPCRSRRSRSATSARPAAAASTATS